MYYVSFSFMFVLLFYVCTCFKCCSEMLTEAIKCVVWVCVCVCVLSSVWCVIQWRRRCVCVCVKLCLVCYTVEKEVCVCVLSSVWCVIQWRRRCVCVCVCLGGVNMRKN